MNWGDEVTVSLTKIVAPGDLAERMKRKNVVALAATFTQLGGQPGNPLWAMKVRGGWKLVAGRDRFAALQINGVKRTKVRPIEDATPEELADLEQVENLFRREVPNRDELIKARVAKLAARIKAEPAVDNGQASAKPGRPVTPEGRAREQVAAETGRSKEAVRKAEQRATAKAEREDEGRDEGALQRVGVPRPAAPPPIDLHGYEMPPQMADIGALVKAHGELIKALRAAKEKASALKIYVSARAGVVADFERHIDADIAQVERETPTDLCPKCKGVEGVTCGLCGENGWVTREQYEKATKKNNHKERANGNQASEGQGGVERGRAIGADAGHVRAGGATGPGVRGDTGADEGGPTGPAEGGGARGGSRPDARAESGERRAQGAGLLAPERRERHIPPIRAGVTYTTDANGDVVEQGPPKKKSGWRTVIANGDGSETEVES